MIPLPSIIQPYVALILLVGALAAFGAGFWSAWSWRADRCEVQVAALEAEQMEAVAAAQARVIATQAAQAKITQEVSHEYQKDVAAIKRRHADAVTRLLNKYATGGCLPVVPHPPSGGDAAARADGFPRDAGAALVDLMLDADLNTRQLVACQGWIKKQSEISDQ